MDEVGAKDLTFGLFRLFLFFHLDAIHHATKEIVHHKVLAEFAFVAPAFPSCRLMGLKA